jgi:hypothetical protein
MEEYIITRDLLILIKETGIPSFETNRGCSWIELTLCTSKLAQKTRRWTFGEEESCADHKIIFFDIETISNEGNATHHFRKCYNTKGDNWGTFVHNLVQNLVKNSDCQTNPNNLKACDKALSQSVKLCTATEVIHKLSLAVTAACDVSFQVLRPGKRASKERSVPWWTNKLTTLQKKLSL